MRGTLFDSIWIVFSLFIVSFGFIIGYQIYSSFLSVSSGVSGFNQEVLDTVSDAFGVLDYVFLFLTIGLGLSSAILAFFIRTHPIFFVVSLLLFIIIIPISAIFSNIFNEFAINEQIIASANEFPFMLFIMQNLPMIISILGIVIMIALYINREVHEV